MKWLQGSVTCNILLWDTRPVQNVARRVACCLFMKVAQKRFFIYCETCAESANGFLFKFFSYSKLQSWKGIKENSTDLTKRIHNVLIVGKATLFGPGSFCIILEVEWTLSQNDNIKYVRPLQTKIEKFGIQETLLPVPLIQVDDWMLLASLP